MFFFRSVLSPTNLLRVLNSPPSFTAFINSLNIQTFADKFKLAAQIQRMTYLNKVSETIDDREVFKINCKYEVEEQSFYEQVDDLQVIRGYPIYAACN